MQIRFILVTLLTLLFALGGYSQTQLSGKVLDSKTSEKLMDARVALLSAADSSVVKAANTDENGAYTLDSLNPGNYILKTTLFEYVDQFRNVTLPEEDTVLDVILKTDTKLEEVTVEANAVRVEQKGDTTQYNADAYKTNPDATVQDLITKMPGITLENGVVKAQGEQITKVMIDGQEFFGDDAAAAMKNLPAEIVSKIQVYDQASDQAKFTGISDGNEAKALNIVTKAGKNNGQFGKIYAGYGTPNDLYMAGANVNFFKGTRRFSIVGMSNNVNQQNFSTDDILGVTGSTASSQSRGGPGGPGGRGGFGGPDNENYLVSQQNGVSTTHGLGLNFSDKWGKNKTTKVTGSYFFNASNTKNSQQTNRTYVLSTTAGQVYSEDFLSTMKNANHRLNFKFDIALDSMNSLVINPKVSYQGNEKAQTTDGTTADASNVLINQINNRTFNETKGLNASTSVLWRHRFAKPRRTFSANITGTYNIKEGDNGQLSSSRYYDELGQDSLAEIDQHTDNNTNGYGVNGRFSFTEPLSKTWSSEFYYAPAYTVSNADKRTYDFDTVTNSYYFMDTTLSNVFENQTIVNEGGTNFRFQKNKVGLQLGLSYQNSLLMNVQEFPTNRDVNLSFNSILPNVRFKYDFTKSRSLMLNYRAGTRNPTIDQLQNVIDNSNPLSLSSGNPDLKQQYNHRVFGRFNNTNIQKATNFNIFFGGEMNQNYISNATIIATSDTVVNGNVLLLRGAQFRQPVNLQGSYNARTTISYGFSLTKLKLNLNFYLGGAYTVAPGLINNVVNKAKTSNANGGLTVSSNISENLDFTVGYTLNYNNVVNTRQNVAQNEYFVHNVNARFNWIIKERLVINSTYSVNAYAGLGSGYNQTIMLWNGGIGYKLLKKKQLELRVSVFDILNNNNSITRNVTESYIEDVKSNVLNRYYMVTLTYNLRNFGTKAPETKETKPAHEGGMGGPPFGPPTY
ncbi:outer membrane beta-barrel protein [Fluviicola sp.]|uniref:outer membrane beta-barrel protein n=1 Tax=Fluviicola sp. TaxID=1917219 RepID=UPI0031D67A8E